MKENVKASEVPKGRLAMWLLIAGEIAIFGGIIVTYILYRLRFPEWGEQSQHTSTLLGAINTMILLTSSYTVVLAHDAAVKKNLARVKKFMLITIAFGFCFLIVKSIEYTNEISHGFTLTSPTLSGTAAASATAIGANFWSFYFLITGFHGVHIIVGMIFMFVVYLKARKGINLQRVEYAGMYWHMVDVIWVFLFPLLYIAK